MNLLQGDFIYRAGREAGASDAEILNETSNRGKLVNKQASLLYRDALEQAKIKPSASYPHGGGS